jgi:predicted small lipoprotein YifL
MPMPPPPHHRVTRRAAVLAAILGGLAACGRKGEIIDLVRPPPDPEPSAPMPQHKEPAG